MEYLSWKKIRTIGQEESFIMKELNHEKITQLNDNTILIVGTTKSFDTNIDVPYKEIISLGASQFRSTNHLEEAEYHYTLFWSSEVDTTKIDIRHLLNQNNN